MPKMTIYVSEDLKAAMDKVEDQTPNWSSIAQVAFQAEAERLSTRKRSAGKMDAVIERLRASKERSTNEAKAKGRAAGRRWAMEFAEFAELKALADTQDHFVGDEGLVLSVGSRIMGYDLGERLDEYEVGSIQDFWENQTDSESAPSDEFVEAFVEGALEVYDDVNDKL